MKFSPNRCFRLFKQAFRRTKVGCLDDIARVVEKSAIVNHAQLVGSQDGEVIVPTYDWAQFFDRPFQQKALKGIKAMHQLTFTDSNKGSVFVRDDINTPERQIKLVQDDEWRPSAQALPPSHFQDCPCSAGSTCLKRYGSSAHQTVKTSCALIHHWICLQQRGQDSSDCFLFSLLLFCLYVYLL